MKSQRCTSMAIITSIGRQFDTVSLPQNNRTGFSPMAYDLQGHGYLTWFTESDMDSILWSYNFPGQITKGFYFPLQRYLLTDIHC